jgi:Ni/Fe-hydrogenase 1 B-type cytochrome subunit
VENIKPKYEWSVAIRLNHWIMALAIFVLIATGFLISDPMTINAGETVNKFSVGYIRYVHIFFGVVLTFIFIWRLYLAFFSTFHADWKDFLAWTDLKLTIQQIRFYLLIDKKGPEYKTVYGPMQALAYLGLMGMIVVIVFTGLILMGGGYSTGITAIVYKILKPFENMLGGLAMVRYIHHIFTWFFILFIIVHIYMAFWYDAVLKKGTVSSMISGRLFEKVKS